MPSDLTGKIRKVDKDAFAYGSSTEIWKGEWKSPPPRSGYRWLAIKVIRTALPAPRVKELGQKLMREASLWADLDDPNVVPLLGMVYDMVPRGVPSLVSPYYQNRNLKDYMKRNRTQLSYSQMLDMTYQFASGLEYLHKSNIVHGDLKPDNIMISDGGEVVISDFGLSRILDAAGFTTKNFYGSVRYTAPELLGFGGPSGSSQPIRTTMDADIWAFAITSTEV
ncbi:hypothetical protein SCLCIDRAFT_1217818 [Scleroderma citrinum Foug A]|uniref:Protein kinase domain-containing protein n=1 Tax=Scleroderma citrinum Foug A TaxID=1036808 RepID=A0A0C3DEY6_9AGAM|nr:hypothetical protein SCLCIDRAFT_1217818 [Scleroderma citrinum Foug A]